MYLLLQAHNVKKDDTVYMHNTFKETIKYKYFLNLTIFMINILDFQHINMRNIDIKSNKLIFINVQVQKAVLVKSIARISI